MKRHPHPVYIIESMSRFVLLLLLPLLRGLLSLRSSVLIWLRGAWFDLAVLFLILFLGFAVWLSSSCCVLEDGIRIVTGIFRREDRFLPYAQLSSLRYEKPFYYIPIGAVRIYLDTDAGAGSRSDARLTLRKKDAEYLFRKATRWLSATRAVKRVYQPKWLYIAALSLITSNTLTGALFFWTFFTQAGRIFGTEFQDTIYTGLTDLANFLAFGLPPAAVILAYVILGGWLISFLMGLVRHRGFSTTRKGNTIQINTGVIIWRKYLLQVDRIHLVEIRQSLMTKLLGLYSVFVRCTGYGKQKNEVAVLMPAADRQEARRNLKLLLPEIKRGERTLRPRAQTITRFLLIPTLLIVAIGLLFAVLIRLLTSFGDTLLFVGIMAELPAVWYLLVRVASFFHTGIGLSDGVYTCFCTYGFRFCTYALPKQKVARFTFRQTIFQRWFGFCDLLLYPYAEQSRRIVVPNLYLKDIAALMETELPSES